MSTCSLSNRKNADQKQPKREFKDGETVIWTGSGVELKCTIIGAKLFDPWWKYKIKKPDGTEHGSWIRESALSFGS